MSFRVEKRRGSFGKIFAYLLGSALIGWIGFLTITHSRKETPPPSSLTENAPSVSTPRAEASNVVLSQQETSKEAEPELKKLVEAVRNTLPDPRIFKARSAEEVHHTPPEILEAGRKLGALAEYLETHPAEIPAALPTYVDCALNTKTMESIRALCAYRLEAYSSHWDDKTRSAYAKVPESIRNLAARLNSD